MLIRFQNPTVSKSIKFANRNNNKKVQNKTELIDYW